MKVAFALVLLGLVAYVNAVTVFDPEAVEDSEGPSPTEEGESMPARSEHSSHRTHSDEAQSTEETHATRHSTRTHRPTSSATQLSQSRIQHMIRDPRVISILSGESTVASPLSDLVNNNRPALLAALETAVKEHHRLPSEPEAEARTMPRHHTQERHHAEEEHHAMPRRHIQERHHAEEEHHVMPRHHTQERHHAGEEHHAMPSHPESDMSFHHTEPEQTHHETNAEFRRDGLPTDVDYPLRTHNRGRDYEY